MALTIHLDLMHQYGFQASMLFGNETLAKCIDATTTAYIRNECLDIQKQTGPNSYTVTFSFFGLNHLSANKITALFLLLGVITQKDASNVKDLGAININEIDFDQHAIRYLAINN